MIPVLQLTLDVRGMSGAVLIWRKFSWYSFNGATTAAGREGDIGGPLDGDAVRANEEDEAILVAAFDRTVKVVLLGLLREFAPAAEDIEW